MRKRSFFAMLLSLLTVSFAVAQQGKPGVRRAGDANNRFENRKYPSLLWEISGKGMKKPSYLFGTMHVSDKLAFHLGDSFYHAINNAEVVALETNPENWQDDFSRSVFYKTPNGLEMGRFIAYSGATPDDNLSIASFAIEDYTEAMKASLAVEPSMINGMLYRTYGTQTDDFEEDTYLDMYIFQTGKKLGKRLTGVENFEASEKLVMEAYRDMIRDRNRKRRSYDFDDMYSNPKKVEDAYRRGDLDVLDSLETLSVESDAFQEKFLYKRNEIQANSIDSIIRRSRLFVAVGAAHLPGRRGVIELLRRMGYTLRPVIMDDRNSLRKEVIDKTRFPVTFTNQTSDDGFYQVGIPGKKFYKFTNWRGIDVVQYADMINGAYYMVTRVKTNSLSWGHDPEYILKRIDSALYENVPGKILSRKPIVKNGYKGWEIRNRTRRGDYQRYNIFVTPFEIIVFKISGNGEYVNEGAEAEKFFGSIRMKEYRDEGWSRYQPPTGGFSIEVPHSPSLLKGMSYGSARLEYSAVDKEGNSYLLLQMSQHYYSFLEEDTFQLKLLGESYAFSSFIKKELAHSFTHVGAYPALDCRYVHHDGSFSQVRFSVRGPLFYAAIVHYKKENPGISRFLNSFTLTPFIYPEVKPRSDSLMKYTVQSPLPVYDTKQDNDNRNYLQLIRMYQFMDDADDDSPDSHNEAFRYRFVGNDTIGEKILVTYNAPGQYTYYRDTAELWKEGSRWEELTKDSSFIIRTDRKYPMSGGGWVRELQLADTGSSRVILSKWIYHDGHLFSLTSLTDTLGPRSIFLEKFFATFTPADTLKKQSLLTKKTSKFFEDYFSSDSLVSKKARKELYSIRFDSTDVPLLKMAINRVNWNTKNYLDVKKHFISKLAQIRDSTITPFLVELYRRVGDSSELQNQVLSALLRQKTRASFTAFKDLVTQEPPLSPESSSGDYNFGRSNFVSIRAIVNADRGWDIESTGRSEDPRFKGPWATLYDTLSLTRTLFPSILQLVSIDDYKETMLNLLAVMVDSGYLQSSDYESQFSKLYLDGRQLLKKQFAKEDEENIDKASRKDNLLRYYYDDDEKQEAMEYGNDDLDQYSILLLPFYDKNPGVNSFFTQLLKTRDRQLLFNTFVLLLRNNKPVPDSLFNYFAKLDGYRVKLYLALEKMNKPQLFPPAWKTQEHITISLLNKELDDYRKPDSIVFLDKLPVTYRGKDGWVYFYKYRRMRDDTQWQLASVGMQPGNLDSIDARNDEFTQNRNRKLRSDRPVSEQLQEYLKELLYAKRRGSEDFYDARSFNYYNTYLSELVKRQRFRD